MWSILRFLLLTALVLGGLFYGIAIDYYIDQRNKTANVILTTLKTELSDLSYTLSKRINSDESITTHRTLFDRVVANNKYIKSISVFDDKRKLLSSDPLLNSVPNNVRAISAEIVSPNTFFSNNLHLSAPLRFYIGNTPKTYQLYFVLDYEELNYYFDKGKNKILISFFILPALIAFAFALLIHKYLITPLTDLRNFAFNQSLVPKKQPLQEIESIRLSMVQTFQRLQKEKQSLYRTAHTDVLSGLSNRLDLEEFIESAISTAEKTEAEFAFIFLDIDDFKVINDSLGHNVGDNVIRELSKIISNNISSQDFVARVGGDEFIIIMQDYRNSLALEQKINHLLNSIKSSPLAYLDKIYINASAGISIFPSDGKDYLSLMQKADIAMYHAKQSGKSRYHFYTESLNLEVQKQIHLDLRMREALIDQEYQLFYQPKIDLATNQIFGAEALIRWIKDDGEIISLDEFIPLAERNGFIVELGDWVLETALKQLSDWQIDYPDFVLSINIATKQLLEDKFITRFKFLMHQYNINPKQVDLEITEYLFLEQNDRNTNIIDQLRATGVSISLDDFGTGFSSLSYLKKFYVDQIKIDKAFIDDFKSQSGRVFIDTIIKLGANLDKKVVAEGVETEDQANYLRQSGCDYGQGFFFSKPLGKRNFEKFLSKDRT